MSSTSAHQFIPAPPLPSTEYANMERRLWVGNLDEKITEYSLLRLMQKYGKIEAFDFLVHKGGPMKGKPKGFCFVTYSTIEEANRAIKCLHNRRAHHKRLAVKPAKTPTNDLDDYPVARKPDNPSEEATASTSSGSSTSGPAGTSSSNVQIQAIEAKLRQMQDVQSSDTPFNSTYDMATSSSLPAKPISAYQYNIRDKAFTKRKPYENTSKPYSRMKTYTFSN